LGLHYIIKVFLFFLYVPYEQRYCDANFYFKKRHRHRHYRLISCTIAIFVARGASDQVQTFAISAVMYVRQWAR